MQDEILSLQRISESLEPPEKTRDKLFELVKDYANSFLNNLETLPAYVQAEKIKIKTTKLQTAWSIEEILECLQTEVDKYGINPASPGHLGYIAGGGIFASALGDFLADVTNRFTGLTFASPNAVAIENQIINWTKELIGFPTEALGNLTSGGSMANLIAIITARDAHNIKASQVQKSVVYLSKQTHHSIQKALRIAGLDECVVRYIQVDSNYRINYNHLQSQINKDQKSGLKPFLIVASCGTTDTGAIDPLNTIGQLAKEKNIWYHIDAAYGGYFILCDKLKHKFRGIELADSIVMDPHKTLFMPYGSGLVIIRNGIKLFESFHYTANYLQDANTNIDNISPADLSPELTKHSRGLRMWLPLKLYGIEVFTAALSEKHLLAKYFYKKIQELGFEVGPPPDLSICIYRMKIDGGDDNLFNAQLVDAIQQDGRIFVSSTTIDDIFWIRIAIACFRTHLKTIDLYLNILNQKVIELTNT